MSEDIDFLDQLSEKDISLGKGALTKVRGMTNYASHLLISKFWQITKLAKRIFHSSLLREDLASCCARAKIEPKLIKRSVPTRWNSVAEMLNSALDIHGGLDKLVEMDRHNKDAKTAIKKYRLTHSV